MTDIRFDTFVKQTRLDRPAVARLPCNEGPLKTKNGRSTPQKAASCKRDQLNAALIDLIRVMPKSRDPFSYCFDL